MLHNDSLRRGILCNSHHLLQLKQGKLRAELLGTARKKLEDSGDAPRSTDLIFAKSPADLKNLHENNSGGDGALILQHLEDRDGNTLLHWALERADEE